MDNIIINNEQEFDEFIKKLELSQEINFKEFSVILNAIIKASGGNFYLKFDFCKEDINEEEYKILKEKIDKINENEEDKSTLYRLFLYTLLNNADLIEEQLGKVTCN